MPVFPRVALNSISAPTNFAGMAGIGQKWLAPASGFDPPTLRLAEMTNFTFTAVAIFMSSNLKLQYKS